MVYENLRKLRESYNLTQEEFGKSIGIAKTTYNNYETGVRDPRSDFWISVAQKYGVTIDYLMGISDAPRKRVDEITPANLSAQALAVAKNYTSLDVHGKTVVDLVITEERRRLDETEAPEENAPKTKIIPLFSTNFAAGFGEPDTGNMWEDYEVPADSPADFAIHVSGDSMEPYLHDGTIALGKKGEAKDGDVAAFMVDGYCKVKQFCHDAFNNLYLFSLNRDRADADETIWADSGRCVTCFGRILMDKHFPLPI